MFILNVISPASSVLPSTSKSADSKEGASQPQIDPHDLELLDAARG